MKFKVTKLEASKRQLETAIELWFQDADPVSVHTLTAAARQIVIDLNTKRGGAPMGADRMENKPKGRKLAHKAIAEAENFFKHADNDPEAVLHFSTEATQFMLLEAVDKY